MRYALAMLVLLAGCTAVNVDMGIAKTTITLALAEPSSVATITTDDSIPVIATTVAGAATSQVQSNYNCAGMVVLPKSVYRALKAKAFPDGMPTATPAALNIPLGGAALTVGTVIVETGEPIEIATDTLLDVTFSDNTVGKQNCAGMFALKLSVYRAMRALAYPDKTEAGK